MLVMSTWTGLLYPEQQFCHLKEIQLTFTRDRCWNLCLPCRSCIFAIQRVAHRKMTLKRLKSYWLNLKDIVQLNMYILQDSLEYVSMPTFIHIFFKKKYITPVQDGTEYKQNAENKKLSLNNTVSYFAYWYYTQFTLSTRIFHTFSLQVLLFKNKKSKGLGKVYFYSNYFNNI